MPDNKNMYIYGKHALTEALLHKSHCVKKVFLASHVHDEELKQLLVEKKIKTAPLFEKTLGRYVEGASHQGVIGLVSVENLVVPYGTFKETIKINPDTSFVLLNEIQDPHNVGAIIRTAAAFGVSGVLFPSHNQAGITGAVVKVSAGMAFRVPLVLIGNVNQTIRDLKERGFWIYGLEGGAKKSITEETFDAPAVFVFGNEAEGIREKTKETCDVLLSIPMHKRAESLNVAASAAIALFKWSETHPKALVTNPSSS